MSAGRTWENSAVARVSVRSRAWAWLAVSGGIAAAAARRGLPAARLERDEGEAAYFGPLCRGGPPPYALAYNLKLPGIYGVYALVLAVFGQTPAAIRIGLIVVTSATTAVTYLLGARLAAPAVGLATAAIFPPP